MKPTYDDVVSICDAHGICLPVDYVGMVVEIVKHATAQAAPVPQDGDERVAKRDAFEQLKDWPTMSPREVFYAGFEAALAQKAVPAAATKLLPEDGELPFTVDEFLNAGTELPAPIASAEEALYTMDQMREYADNFHLSRMRILVAEKEAYERHAPKPEPYGYAPIHENGNYFTRNKSTADYVGGMMPVYAAAQPSIAAPKDTNLVGK